jgi:hypothetical protein
MRAEEFKQLLKRSPFVPLRVCMTDGKSYDIRHPDNIIVLHQRIDIGVGAGTTTGVADRVEYCLLLHVVRVEELASPAPDRN